jgi:glycosidase
MSKAPTFEFHVGRAARDRYNFADTLFSITGNVVFADPAASREFATRINKQREASRREEPVNPGALNGMGLIDEALHAIIGLYRQRLDPKVMTDALAWFESRLGSAALDRTLLKFADEFPTVDVYRGKLTPAEWLGGTTGDQPNRAIALEELMMLWLANANPAFKPFRELFDDTTLSRSSAYIPISAAFREYFSTRPKFQEQNLFDVLRSPALAAPDSIAGQLAFLREKLAPLLGAFSRRLLVALDVLKEEELAVWMRFHPPTAGHFGGLQTGDSSKAAIPRYGAGGVGQEPEYERFSPDVDWMPRTVMMAKTVYVFLDQLSKQYSRNIYRLDHVPDEELDLLARRGFNALWLIGIWERSRASQRIKQLCGNPDAVASAYSLADYNIAEDLGGESAYKNLRDRAGLRGIKLASDMVPNHMGIDSRWVIEHPDWFLSLPYSPYPAYEFNGPDLSHDGRVEIKIEDHYYNRSDAAVVFRRVDRWSGDTRYVYHGNDGTSFPWNDTAQLNYLRADVREAVIQTILHVARLFPIIRFDAAMTLAKKHYQRLWFPAPGTGGGIPSRAEHGLTKEEFDAAMPVEFWRELVDRVAAEVPGTLLLAEAFWLMEGYFVRTLGMHRVYNSAFMNMLRDEENANYRSVIKNTLEFDPDVLKRYVNFMNNPDERTAVDQFGKGDKYFGVCTLMATLPGLPMFGHGQIEGYTEKYGMEYRRAYYDERPDPWLVARHEREISPILHRRALFAEVQNFLMYDFYTDGGWVNEDVYAYSNRLGNDRAVVVYNNRFNDTSGWIRMSCGYAEKQPDGSRNVRQKSLGESFGLSRDENAFVAFRDALTGLEFLHRSSDAAEKGIRVELGAYKTHVFLDWRDIHDAQRPWGELCDLLHGTGVSSLEDTLRVLELRPLHESVRALLNPELVNSIAEYTAGSQDKEPASVAAPARTAKKSTNKKQTSASTRAPKQPAKRAPAKQSTKPPAIQSKSAPPITHNDLLEDICNRGRAFLEQAHHYASSPGARASSVRPASEWTGTLELATDHLRSRVEAALRLPDLEKLLAEPLPKPAREALPLPQTPLPENRPLWATVLAWCAIDALGQFIDPANSCQSASEAFDTMRLREPFASMFAASGAPGEEKWYAAARLRASFAHAAWAPGAEEVPSTRGSALLSWVHDPDVAWLMGVHEYEGVRYFNQESFERLMWWMSLPALIRLAEQGRIDPKEVRTVEGAVYARTKYAADSGYRVEGLIS